MAKTKTMNTCVCGCGNATGGSFAPGHDNRFFGQVIRGERPVADLASYPGLYGKWEKRTNGEGRTPSKGGQATASVATLHPGLEVRIGRWVYPVVSVEPAGDERSTVTYCNKQGETKAHEVPNEWLTWPVAP